MGRQGEDTATCLTVLETSRHGSHERLVFKEEFMSFFYKDTLGICICSYISNRILRRMGYVFAFSVIL